MPSITGPRRLVARNLKNNVARGKKSSDVDPPVEAGEIGLHSSSVPGLELGATYTAKFKQTIHFPTFSDELNSRKIFKVIGSPFTLDQSLVHSVYPPPGHADYWNVLPHVLFTNPQVPWSHAADDADSTVPWLALLVFTEDELTLTASQASSMTTELGRTPDRSPTFSYNLLPADLVALDSVFTQPLPVTSGADPTPLQAIVIQPSLFAALFAKYAPNSSIPMSGVSQPDLQRYRWMSHVRNFNPTEMANLGGGGLANYSATVAPRTGPLNISAPTTAYVHLISLVDVANNMTFDPARPAALVSLYSWSFTYLPPASFSMEKCLMDLGDSIQPMRNPTAAIVQAAKTRDATVADDWVKSRMLAGFTLIKYRTPTGEPTIGFQRGILAPIKFASVDFPPSDFGTDLAIVDEWSGFLDLTFQLAWELGRSAAMADRTFSAALMRLRRDLHSESLATAKQSLDDKFETGPTMIKSLMTTLPALGNLSETTQRSFVADRFEAPPLGVSTRDKLSFASPAVQNTYQDIVEAATAYAQAVPRSQLSANPSNHVGRVKDNAAIYDETNSPASSDYATILDWIMDRWFLARIPMVNLIPDPAFIPKESMRTFFVDESWFRVFVDGALSVAEHFDEGDTARESIKARLSTFLTTNQGHTGFPPQVPKWGFFLRSEMVTKFPDLRVSAPWSRADAPKEGKLAPVLRMQTLDVDLLCVLFDREPADFDPLQGISLQPPEHQLTSMLGGVEGIVDGVLKIHWKNVFQDPAKARDPSDYNPPNPLSLLIDDPTNGIFDPGASADAPTRSLCPASFARIVHANEGGNADPTNKFPDGTPAMVASQLMAEVPKLLIRPPHLPVTPPSSPHSSPRTHGPLSTSRPRSRRTAKTAPPPTVPSIQSPAPRRRGSTPLTVYPPPLNPMVSVIAKTDLLPDRDSDQIRNLFPPAYPMHAVKPNRCDHPPAQCHLATIFYNAKCLRTDNPFPVWGFAGMFPNTQGFTSDVHVAMLNPTGISKNLAWVEVMMTVGTSPNDLIAPTGTVPVTSPPRRNLYGDYPAQPTHSAQALQGDILPNLRVRAVGPHSRRWRVRSTVLPPDAASSTTPRLSITIEPNRSQGYWDIAQVSDLSFVMESVHLNVNSAPPPASMAGPGANYYAPKVTVTEHYHDQDPDYRQTATVTVPLFSYDASSSQIRFPWTDNYPYPY